MPSLSAATIRYLLILAGIVLLGLLIVLIAHSAAIPSPAASLPSEIPANG
jgi:hypothetical protein